MGNEKPVVSADLLNARSTCAPTSAGGRVGMKAPYSYYVPRVRNVAVCLCLQNKNRRLVCTGFLHFTV